VNPSVCFPDFQTFSPKSFKFPITKVYKYKYKDFLYLLDYQFLLLFQKVGKIVYSTKTYCCSNFLRGRVFFILKENLRYVQHRYCKSSSVNINALYRCIFCTVSMNFVIGTYPCDNVAVWPPFNLHSVSVMLLVCAVYTYRAVSKGTTYE
jgi:hypothetical protein